MTAPPPIIPKPPGRVRIASVRSMAPTVPDMIATARPILARLKVAEGEASAHLYLEGKALVAELETWAECPPPDETRGGRIEALITWARRALEMLSGGAKR